VKRGGAAVLQKKRDKRQTFRGEEKKKKRGFWGGPHLCENLTLDAEGGRKFHQEKRNTLTRGRFKPEIRKIALRRQIIGREGMRKKKSISRGKFDRKRP